MLSLLLVLACTSSLPDDSNAPIGAGGDSEEPLVGCQDPSNWSLGGNGRYCEGSCDGQGIVCADTMSPPRCMVTAASGGRSDCDLPDGEDEALCENAIATTCASLIEP